jgi:hypothetical protein
MFGVTGQVAPKRKAKQMTKIIVIERESHGVILENDRQVHAEGCGDIQKYLSKPNWKITHENNSIIDIATSDYSDLASDYTSPADGEDYWTKACLNEAFAYLSVKSCVKQIVNEQVKPYAKIEVEI